MELHNLGHVELHRGNLDAAERCFSEVPASATHHDLYEAAMAHVNHATLAHGARRPRGCGRASRAHAGNAGRRWIVLDPDDAFEVDWLHDQLG